ncbi:MAG: MBL fold metallo-hydrolase [Propionibacteriaceae bacterium]|nr:MBL fold metallo-hydrolase [Propionibacteriaceae bacterium]
MEFTQVRPGIFLLVAPPESVNVGLVVGQDRAWLIDSGSSPAQGERIRAAAAAVCDRPLAGVALTHGHWDHSFGLTAFADLETVGHQDCQTALRGAESAAAAHDLGLDLDRLPGPARTISLIGLRDLGGGVVLELAHFGPAHTLGDLVVALPGADLFFVGDLIETAGAPQFDPESSLDGWVKSLDSLWAALKPNSLVVPGHGQVAEPWQVGHQRAGLAALWGQTEWAYHQGVALEQIYDHDHLEWPWDRPTAERGIALAYAELRARGPRRAPLPLIETHRLDDPRP